MRGGVHFVCEGQYADGIEKIIRSYLDNHTSKSSQRAAWVSGFFGSGKSHVLKMLCHLWMEHGAAGRCHGAVAGAEYPEELGATTS